MLKIAAKKAGLLRFFANSAGKERTVVDKDKDAGEPN